MKKVSIHFARIANASYDKVHSVVERALLVYQITSPLKSTGRALNGLLSGYGMPYRRVTSAYTTVHKSDGRSGWHKSRRYHAMKKSPLASMATAGCMNVVAVPEMVAEMTSNVLPITVSPTTSYKATLRRDVFVPLPVLPSDQVTTNSLHRPQFATRGRRDEDDAWHAEYTNSEPSGAPLFIIETSPNLILQGVKSLPFRAKRQ